MAAWQETQRQCDELAELVKTVCATIDDLQMATLLVAGCYRHQWEWRRRRVRRHIREAA